MGEKLAQDAKVFVVSNTKPCFDAREPGDSVE